MLGATGRDRHVSAIAAVPGLHLVPGLANASPDEVLADGRVGIVAVLTPLSERRHWVECALGGGRGVLSAAPPAATPAEAAHLEGLARQAGARLEVESPGAWAGFADRVVTCAQGVAPALYTRLRVVVPKAWLVARPEGLLESEVLWAVPLLVAALGPLDTVSAHTRALVRNAPKEDLAIAHLHFACGAEGLVEFHALSAESALATFEIYGPRDEGHVEADLSRFRVEGLGVQYRRLRDAGGPDRGEGGLGAVSIEESIRLADWLRQSARMARRLHRQEIQA